MKRFVFAAATVFFVAMIGAALAEQSSIDTQIKDLKVGDADVRAKAAYDLGCG